MKIAIMQPYFFPYLGYWRLMNHVDLFIILDDVNFIKRGWIARNKIKCRDGEQWLTLPLVNASQNKKINEIDILADNGWVSKLKRSIFYNYQKEYYLKETFPLVEEIIINAHGNLSQFLAYELIKVRDHLGMSTEILRITESTMSNRYCGASRIIHICKALGAKEYVNASGGSNLYSEKEFSDHGIKLNILPPEATLTPIMGDTQANTLSILHPLMCYGKNTLKQYFSKHA